MSIYQLFPFIIFLFSCTCEKIAQLSKICPSFEEIEKNYSILLKERIKQGTSPRSKNFSKLEYLMKSSEVQFYSLLIQSITSHPKMIGVGAYGAVYKLKNNVFLKDFKDPSLAVKLLKVEKDLQVKKNQISQKKLFLEIVVMEKLYNKPGGKYYFPKMLGCVSLTHVLTPLLQGLSPVQLQSAPLRALHSDYVNKEFLTLKMEQLDMSFKTFLLSFLKINNNLMLLDRLKIGLNLLTGLKMINSQFLHCDIKPDNLMIKVVHGEHDLKAPVISTKYGEKFLIKYIDFGISVPKQTRCTGGTFGFAAPEMFNKFGHEKFDIFSLGVLLLEIEMTDLQIPGKLSQVLQITAEMKAFKVGKIQPRIKNRLMQVSLVKLINEFINHPKYKSDFREELSILEEHLKVTGQPSIKDFFKFRENYPSLFGHTLEYFEFVFLLSLQIYVRFQTQIKHSQDSVRELLTLKILALQNDKKFRNAETKIAFNLDEIGDHFITKKKQGFKPLKRGQIKKHIERIEKYKHDRDYSSQILQLKLMIKKQNQRLDTQEKFLNQILKMVNWFPSQRFDSSESYSNLKDIVSTHFSILNNLNQELAKIKDPENLYLLDLNPKAKVIKFEQIDPNIRDSEVPNYHFLQNNTFDQKLRKTNTRKIEILFI